MFTDIPTEQTNAITDSILSVQSIATMLWILLQRTKRPMWNSIWVCVFGLLAIASLFGAILHGINLSDASRSFVWLPIYLTLGLTMAFFALPAIGFVGGLR